MRIAILTSGILPVPAVQGGAVENLIDFYLEYNEQHRLFDITVYSVAHPDVCRHPALQAKCNHYHYIDMSSLWVKVRRRVYGLFHRHEYYNFYIEYFFERAWQHIRRQHYDIIVLENRPGYAWKLSQRGFNNLVLHLHNDLLNNTSPHHQQVFSSISRIITVSDYIKDRVATIAQSDKVMTVYNGIDLTQFQRHETSFVTRKSIGFSDSDFVLVYSGRLNHNKGISELIDAMLLLKSQPQIKLLILGSTFFADASGEDSFVRSLKEKAMPIQERLTFTGFIPYQQMPEYLQLADAGVIPSIWPEPFGLTVIEAQAMGLPTIASRQGGIPEIISEENAVIVPTGHDYATQLANAILHLYQSPRQRADMAVKAQQNASHYSRERYAHNFLKVLETISLK